MWSGANEKLPHAMFFIEIYLIPTFFSVDILPD